MKFVKGIMILFVFLFVVASPALFAQNVKIDAAMNITKADSASYFNWSIGKKVVKDSFDANSGASVAGSVKEFDAVRFDTPTTKKPTMPIGLRGLLLYPTADFQTTVFDNVNVTQEGKMLTVRYVHRGTAYELTTDKKGSFDLLTGAKMASGLADNVGGKFVLKAEFVKDGTDGTKMADLDWSKITLVPDTKAADASRYYEGKLSFTYKGGMLKVKGNLVQK